MGLKNPSSATHIVEEVKKLKATGKDEFTYALFGWKYKPDTALKRATWRQEERRKRRSLLFKLIINAKKNGYRFETPGGAECVVKKTHDYLAPYVFKFNVDGVEILVYHRKKGLVDFVQSLVENNKEVPCYHIRKIVFRGSDYSPYGNRGEKLLQAIKQNINPFVFAVVNE